MKFFSLLFCLLPFLSHAQIITTVVGNGIAGYAGDGGPASAANITFPKGLAFDNSGNILICHQSLIRKVDASYIISTIAGSLTMIPPGDGGPATDASIPSAHDVTVDSVGNIFISDFHYNKIRKINSLTNIIDAFAGTGMVGSTGDGGPAINAKFNSLASICIDTSNDALYISDAFNYRIRKINLITGIISAFAGTGTSGYTGDGGPATAARFSRVLGLCADRAGNIYIGDWDNARIRKVAIATGVVTTYAGNGTIGYSGDGGPALSAMIAKPSSLCMDTCDNMYFADEDNQVVRRIDAASGIITTVAGNGTAGYSGDGGPATAAQFNHPAGVKIDNSGNLYISDYFNHRVRRMTIVPPAPTVSVTIAATPNDTVCAGTPVTYTATAAGSGAPYYEWYRNGIVVGTSDSYTYTPANGDSVRCVASVNVCGSGTAWASSSMINMVVTPLTPPAISLSGVSSATVGATVTVNATVSSAGSSYSIAWFRNGVLFNTTTVPTVTYVKATGTDVITARVSSTDVMGCYDTTTSAGHTISVAPNGVDEVGRHAAPLVLYPSPVRDVLHLSCAGGIGTVVITDHTGRVVLQAPAGSTELPVQELAPGLYMIQVQGLDGSRQVGRFVKE